MRNETARPDTLAQAFSGVRRRRSTATRAFQMLRSNRLGVVGALILLTVILTALLAPIIAPHDPMAGDVSRRLECPVLTSCRVQGMGPDTARGTTEHLLGTDQIGRDILSRIIYGAQVSLLVGISAVMLGVVIGSSIGLVAGFYGRFLDTVSMRFADIFLAFPQLLLAIAVMAVIGGGLFNVIVVLGIATWVPFARLIRGSVLSAKTLDYVVAARAIGSHDIRLLGKHVLPNVLTPVIVFGTFQVALTIIAEAGLSFLGLGVGPTRPTWGGMLSQSRDYIETAWWLATFPGIAIVFTVLSINLLGDWLRDFLDPRLRNAAD
jgi:peptide/nickel transport system permease protein